MQVFRLSKTKFAKDLEGIGAKLYGGRWNNPGTACIYTSMSRSLAVLEFASNVELDLLPPNLSMTTYDVPENEFLKIELGDLPRNWKDIPGPESLKELGKRYFENPKLLGIRVPSVIIPDEFNFVINPESEKIGNVKVLAAGNFVFDLRIKM